MKRLAIIVTAGVAAVIAMTGGGQHAMTPASAATVHVPKATAARHRAPLLGVYEYSETNYTLAETKSYGTAVLGYIRGKLDAQVAGLMWDLCSPGFRSEVVHACAADAGTGSMSPSDIAALATIAKADGLQIQMRPIIRVGPPSGWNIAKRSWEGHIQPPNQQKWFENLLAAELPYLRVAKADHVEQFVVGSELAGLQYSRSWPWFLARAHADCGCQVAYPAEMSQYIQNPGTLPRTQALGTDLYPKLNLPANASQARVTAGWEASLSKVPASQRSQLERTSLDEVSIRATAGAYKRPTDWNLNGKPDPEVQVRYFTAACQTAAKYHLQALFFYFVPLNDNPAAPVNFPAFFVNNAGSRAIQGCRKILAG
jgi:hypothetical protein